MATRKVGSRKVIQGITSTTLIPLPSAKSKKWRATPSVSREKVGGTVTRNFGRVTASATAHKKKRGSGDKSVSVTYQGNKTSTTVGASKSKGNRSKSISVTHRKNKKTSFNVKASKDKGGTRVGVGFSKRF